MFSNKTMRAGAVLSGLLMTGALAAADPVPSIEFDFAGSPDKEIRTGSFIELGKNVRREGDALVFDGSAESNAKVTGQKLEKWRKNVDLRLFSAAFKIRFDKPLFGGAANAQTASLGLFDCRLTEDGYLEIVLYMKPTEITGDSMVLRSVDKVKYGEWAHVELIYDTNRQLYSLYLNGKYQFSNDEWTMPLVEFKPLVMGDGFKGAIADFRVYEAPLNSEDLALTDKNADWFNAVQAEITGYAKDIKNASLRSWAQKLAKQAETLGKNPARVTIAQAKNLNSEFEKIKTLNEGIKAPGTINDRALTVYSISATSQNAILPNELPKEGKLTNSIQMAMAQDEFESVGVVVVPFAPFKNFKPVISDLKNGKNVIKASDVDIKVVKRMYRGGGAWMTYHCDIRSRILVPDLLLNDDDLLRVDTVKRINYLKVQYPTGTVYTDVSRFLRNKDVFGHNKQFIKDADMLQPLQMPEAGQNQEYIFTFHAKKDTVPGFYDGTITFQQNNIPAATMKITVRVLPFALPEAKTNYDLTKSYYSHINGFNGTKECLQDLLNHNFCHASGLTNERVIRFAKEIGYPLKELVGTIFDCMNDGSWRHDWTRGLPQDKITPEVAAHLDRIFLAPVIRSDKKLAKWIGSDDFMRWVCTSSEASNYWAVYANVDRISNLCRENTKVRFFTHGGVAVQTYGCGGPIDMNSNTVTDPKLAQKWHTVDGKEISYAYPFPGPENPNWFRRALGLESYLANYDGHMMHGFLDDNLNDFAFYLNGDGNYRSFSLAIDQYSDKIINRLCIIGCREAYDDVRYATLLQQQAKAAMQSKDALIVREGKRQLAWLNDIDRKRADMDDFRIGCQWRILTLKNLIETRAKGK